MVIVSIIMVKMEYVGKFYSAIVYLIIKMIIGNNIFFKVFLVFDWINVRIDICIKILIFIEIEMENYFIFIERSMI